MTAKLRAIRSLWANGAPVVAGEQFTVDDALAGQLLSSGKAEPADARTRERMHSRSCTWAEATPEAAGLRPWARGR